MPAPAPIEPRQTVPTDQENGHPVAPDESEKKGDGYVQTVHALQGELKELRSIISSIQQGQITAPTAANTDVEDVKALASRVDRLEKSHGLPAAHVDQTPSLPAAHTWPFDINGSRGA